jgi:hypothetical protein
VDGPFSCKVSEVVPVLKFGIVGGGVQLGPLGTAATNRPIVLTPGDYDDGEIGRMMIGRGNRSTRRKPAPVPLCPPQTPHTLPGRELGPPRLRLESVWESGCIDPHFLDLCTSCR